MSALERTLAHREKCVKTYTKASPLALTTKGKRERRTLHTRGETEKR